MAWEKPKRKRGRGFVWRARLLSSGLAIYAGLGRFPFHLMSIRGIVFGTGRESCTLRAQRIPILYSEIKKMIVEYQRKEASFALFSYCFLTVDRQLDGVVHSS